MEKCYPQWTASINVIKIISTGKFMGQPSLDNSSLKLICQEILGCFHKLTISRNHQSHLLCFIAVKSGFTLSSLCNLQRSYWPKRIDHSHNAQPELRAAVIKSSQSLCQASQMACTSDIFLFSQQSYGRPHRSILLLYFILSFLSSFIISLPISYTSLITLMVFGY